MGVMSCSRNECNEIMCNTYIEHIGYVCDECQDEFKLFLKIKNKTRISEGEMKRQLDTFMKTYKGSFEEGKIMDADEFFENYKNE